MPFRDLAGHHHLFELMARAARRGTLPPSLIFAGPEGVGKRRAAVALAQFLNCTGNVARMVGASAPGSRADMVSASELGSREDMVSASELGSREDMVRASELGSDALGNDSCGQCPACRRIARGVHADMLLIEPGDTGTIKVDQVRDAVERSAYRPFEGRRRVVIVDDADAMMGEAQNALLKTLEEPPAASTFVLVTSRPDVLLPTVRSRCQRLRFGPLSPADVAAVLVRDHGYAPADAHAAAAAANGSIGAALEGASDDYTNARDAAAALLQGVAAAADSRRRLNTARSLAATGAARGASERDALARRLRAMRSLLRDLGVLLSRADERGLAHADLKPFLSGLLGSFDRDRTLRAFSAVDRALAALDRNASPKIVADWLAFQI